MPEIMRQYGASILSVVAVGALFTLLFFAWPSGSGSVLGSVGSKAGSQLDERQGTGGGTTAFDDHASRSKPVAAFDGAYVKGVKYASLAEAFTIMDADGAQWDHAQGAFVLGGEARGGSVEIKSLMALSDGTDYVNGTAGEVHPRVTYVKETGEVTFNEAGVYRVKLGILDGDNVAADYVATVVVDGA